RRLDELQSKAAIVGPEFEARLAKDRTDAERVHLERLIATADSAAKTQPLDRAALTALGQVEDDVFRMLDASAKLQEKNRNDAALNEKVADLTAKYKSVMSLSDDCVGRFYTPEAIETAPWRDLLTDAKAWKTTEAKGFEHSLEGGVLHLVTTADQKDQSVISI